MTEINASSVAVTSTQQHSTSRRGWTAPQVQIVSIASVTQLGLASAAAEFATFSS